MPKKKEDMTAAEREKMLARLADMRAKVQENKKLKAEAAAAGGGGSSDVPPSRPNAEVFGAAKIDIKKPVPKKNDELVLERLDKVATHLEELASYKKEKVKAKKQKEEEAKVKEEVKAPSPAAVAAPTVEFQFPRSYGNRFFQGGRF